LPNANSQNVLRRNNAASQAVDEVIETAPTTRLIPRSSMAVSGDERNKTHEYAAKESVDSQLIAAARDGDPRAFANLVERYENKIARTVIAMLGDSAEADDVGQETFIRFYRSLDSFREESALGTYLTRIAINLSLNELKRRKRRGLFFGSSVDATDAESR
jgi:hypothetical protein